MTKEELKNKISEHKECCKKLAEEYRQRYNKDNTDKLALNMFYHNVISYNDFETVLAIIEDRDSMIMCFSEPPYLTEETVEVNIKRIAELEKENAELKQAKEGKVVEHFEAYGQCRDSRRIAELEATNKKISAECHKLVDSLEKKQKEIAELKADNDARKFAMAMSEKVEKQLREENAKLNVEWQEEVQKSTDEGYARTLQTIQLSKVKEIIRNLLSAYTTYADSFDDRDNEIVEEAVHFLSEVEK